MRQRWNAMRIAGATRRARRRRTRPPMMIRAPASTQTYSGPGDANKRHHHVNPARHDRRSIAMPPAREMGCSCNDRSLGWSTSQRRRSARYDPARGRTAATANATTPASAIAIHACSIIVREGCTSTARRTFDRSSEHVTKRYASKRSAAPGHAWRGMRQRAGIRVRTCRPCRGIVW